MSDIKSWGESLMVCARRSQENARLMHKTVQLKGQPETCGTVENVFTCGNCIWADVTWEGRPRPVMSWETHNLIVAE